MPDAIKAKSDGLVLELADGRTVRPKVWKANDDMFANMVWVEEQEAMYGRDADDHHVMLGFEEVED